LLQPSVKQQAESVPICGPFKLLDQNGTRVTDQTFAGKPSVIYFGYTSCPDACPTTLSDLLVTSICLQIDDRVAIERLRQLAAL
jgi:protein SCO1/2